MSPRQQEESTIEDQRHLAEATKAANARIGFYFHLVVYTLVHAGLIAINLSASAEHLWFEWPLFGWGIGIFFHALAVFILPKGRPIRERLIAREMKKRTLQKP